LKLTDSVMFFTVLMCCSRKTQLVIAWYSSLDWKTALKSNKYLNRGLQRNLFILT
jgi:hypothetical protein